MRFLRVFLVIFISSLFVLQGKININPFGSFQFAIMPMASVITILFFGFIYFKTFKPQSDKKWEGLIMPRVLGAIVLSGSIFNLLTAFDDLSPSFLNEIFMEVYVNDFWLICFYQSVVFLLMGYIFNKEVKG